MMKSYFFFLLLITSNITLSISAPLPTSLLQLAWKGLRNQAIQTEFSNVINVNQAITEFSNEINAIFNGQSNDDQTTSERNMEGVEGPSYSQPVKEIQGLYLIKQYLYNFGYLQQSESFDNLLDEETISAIKIYQQNFNLQVTGDLTNQTLQQILLPRCGVPDINFEYSLSDTVNESWPKGNTWFPKGTKNLTYAFAPVSKIPLKVTKVFRNALTRWSTTTKLLNFTETSSYNDANIKIGFYNYDDIVDQYVVLGDTFISLQLNSSAKSGVVRLDASKIWVLPTYNHTWSWLDWKFDLESVVMHQIGHLLGLDHSFEEDSIMYPTILPSQQRKVEITNSDNQTIHQLYTNAFKVNANHGYAISSSSLLIALFLGFAFMALLN